MTVPAALFRSSFALPRAGAQLPASMQESLCASDQPLVMLPVRLETRFFAQPEPPRATTISAAATVCERFIDSPQVRIPGLAAL